MTVHVIVAEDDTAIREFITDALTAEGYAVGPAADGREALRQVVTGGPELLLTDLQMPVMSGWELLTQVRRCGLVVPVVVMSAGCDVAAAAARLGADGALPKPFDLAALLHTVERFIPNPCA